MLEGKIMSFSPLAGIRYAETSKVYVVNGHNRVVSVPLRGLDMRKRIMNICSVRLYYSFQSPCGD